MRYLSVLLIILASCKIQDSNKSSQIPKTIDTCGYIPYVENPSISNKNGIPIDSESAYIPLDYFFDVRDTSHLKIDTGGVKWLSDILYEFEEPILSNYFLNKTIYRFTFINGWGSAYVMTVINECDSSTIISKQLNKVIRRYKKIVDSTEKISLHKKLLTNSQFDSLKGLIHSLNPITIPHSIDYGGLDGYTILLEIHSKNGYIYIIRWAPREDTFQKIRKKFTELSGVHDFYF